MDYDRVLQRLRRKEQVSMKVDLEAEEIELLRTILAEHIAGLREEAHHTDARNYKEQLRQDEAVLQGIQQKLQAPPR
jgi:hypothetical protein